MSEPIDNVLERITEYLGLGFSADRRLKLKADLMKRIIFLCHKWETGNYNVWLDKLSAFTNLSVRRTQENYLDPLITLGIIRFVNRDAGTIRFYGLDLQGISDTEIRHMGGAESKEELEARKKEFEIRAKKEKEGNEAEEQTKKVKEGKS
jgi:hypothetical protein